MKVKLWRLAVPIYAENRAVYETLQVGQGGVVDIDVNDHGVVLVDRGPSVPRLIVHGAAWGQEAERPKAAEQELRLEASKVQASVHGTSSKAVSFNVPLKGAKS